MHPPTFPPSPLPTFSFSHHLTFSLLTLPSLFPFAFKSFSDRIFSLTLKQNL